MWELGHKKVEHQELWRFLRVPWIVRVSNQSILKEINPEYSLEGLMLKLKFQYFGKLMQRANSLEKTLNLGKIEGSRRRGVTEDEMIGWHHWFNWHEFEQTLGESDGKGSLACCSPWGHRVGHDWATELNWTETFKSTCILGRPKIAILLLSSNFIYTGEVKICN